MKIEYFTRKVFGDVRAYPANDFAKQCLELVGGGNSTFSYADLKRLQKLGHECNQVLDPSLIFNLEE